MTRISERSRKAVVARATGRCEYCRLPDELQIRGFEVDHIQPASLGGRTTLDNLAYACPACNGAKSAHTQARDPLSGLVVALFNPRADHWDKHFAWSKRKPFTIRGTTPVGRATIALLRLNSRKLVEIRRRLAACGIAVIPEDRV